MSTLTVNHPNVIRVSAVRRELSVQDCAACAAVPLLVPAGEFAICPACRAADIMAKARGLVFDVIALRDGLPPYDELTAVERAEELAALDITPGCIHVTDRQLEASIRAMDDDRLIATIEAYPQGVGGRADLILCVAADELANRLGHRTLEAQERWPGECETDA